LNEPASATQPLALLTDGAIHPFDESGAGAGWPEKGRGGDGLSKRLPVCSVLMVWR